MMITLMLHSTLMMTLLTLMLPMITATHQKTITKTTKLAIMTSLAPALLFINLGLETSTTNLTWLPMNFNLQISFILDIYSVLFMPVALFITWTILEFAEWYMNSDPHQPKFSKYLLLFLIAMMVLTTANNMLQLFVGWEGVGIMSFLLIGWWGARTNANTSALQAIMYNRIGDIGLILALAWTAMNLNTWEIQQMFSHQTTPLLPLLGLILAAMGKSAQFGLHPWLPAAMEGPTPVSALLHSSTMVVAGVFLLVRLHPLLQSNHHALTICLCLGATTTTFAALCAITQNDIKKIIAFSTSSQLGLMMLTIGMNQPQMAFLHIITHAFFKAMLFLCSGSIIHSLNNEQDIRKMGGLQKTLPITTTCMTLGSFALAGTPFLAGFYTKDTIIETMNTSSLNAWALLVTMLATCLTTAYSLRLMFYVQLYTPRHQPLQNLNESNPHQTAPILRLAMGSIMAGLVISSTALPIKPQIMTMTTMTKLSTMLAALIGLISALDLALKTTNLLNLQTTKTHTMLNQLGFFNTLMHRTLPNNNMKLAQTISTQTKDQMWFELMMPMMTKTANTFMANKLSSYHTGTIKTHLITFIIFLASSLMWTKLYGNR